MLQVQFSGKVVAVFDGKEQPDGSVPLIVDVQQKTFKYGGLTTVNWRLRAPRHKLNWCKMQMDKGYTVIIVLSELESYEARVMGDASVPHAYGVLQEILPL